MKLRAIIPKAEDGGYWAEVPAFPTVKLGNHEPHEPHERNGLSALIPPRKRQPVQLGCWDGRRGHDPVL